MEVLNREEMKSVMAGKMEVDCASSCSGCIPDNTSHGPCVEWKCVDGEWCVPETSRCCIS